MMQILFRRSALLCSSAALVAALARFAWALPASEGRGERGRLSLELAAESLEARLSYGSSSSNFGCLGLVADEAAALVRGAIRVEGEGCGELLDGPYLAAGPGAPAGCLRLLADPLSYTPVSARASLIALSPSLASGTAVLGAGAAGGSFALEAFAAASGSSGAAAGFLLRRAQFEDGTDEPAFEPRSVATGLGLGVADGEGRWSAIAAASARLASAGGGGWEPAPPPDAAGLILCGALVRERRAAATRALVGLAASMGRLEGVGLAGRVEAEAREGPLFLRLSAACAGTEFRALSGSYPSRGLSLAGDARIALRRASVLACALRLESPRPLPGEMPRLGSSTRLAYSMPFARAAGALEPRVEAARKAGEAPSVEVGLAFRGRREGKGTNLDLALVVDSGKSAAGWKASLSSRARDDCFGIGLGAELGLSRLGGGSEPLVAEATLRVELPLAGNASLEVEAATAKGGLSLAPSAAGDAAPSFAWSIRYAMPIP